MMDLGLKTIQKKICRRVANPQRGSTILLVLAMLSILLLLAIAFSYGTRLETQASNNYAALTQARTAAVTGLPTALPMLRNASSGVTSPLQAWNVVPQAITAMENPKTRSSGLSASQLALFRKAEISVRRGKDGTIESGPQANITIRDMSGMINLNAVENEGAMARVVQAILPGGDAPRKSRALMAMRGKALRPEKRSAGDNTADRDADLDLRDPNARLLDNLARLQLSPDRTTPLFTNEEIQKLEKYVTVFSQAPEVFNIDGETHIPRISFGAIDPELVFERLQKAFPYKKRELLLQFAANVADFSDEDDEPTLLDSNGKIVELTADMALPANITIGVEQVPFITEVYPDSATSAQFGDAGQFVEITNPWGKSISLAGWTLRTTNGNVPLTATLPAGGILVITDNYNTPSPDSQPGQGSLVSIFGVTADGTMKQVMTVPSLKLPDRSSRVSLHNAQGKLVDLFSYDSSNTVDSKKSFQRTDPLVRGWKLAEATPLAPASGGNALAAVQTRNLWNDGNTTMTRLSQLFEMSTGFAEAGIEGKTIHANQTAELTVPEERAKNSDPFPNNMDLRLVDIFTASLPDPGTTPTETAQNAKKKNRQRDAAAEMQEFRNRMNRLRGGESLADLDKSTTSTTTSAVFSYGKLNVNTCPKFALLGLTTTQDATLANQMDALEAYRVTRLRQNQVPFLNVSDFLVRFGPKFSPANLKELDRITDQISVGSSAFEVVGTNRLSPAEQQALENSKNGTGPRPATATAKWLISMDQEPYSIVSFSLVP